jgi:hypothetical protein
LEKIEFLQSHENNDIYDRAFRIIETYFGGESDVELDAAPAHPDSTGGPAANAPGGFSF